VITYFDRRTRTLINSSLVAAALRMWLSFGDVDSGISIKNPSGTSRKPAG